MEEAFIFKMKLRSNPFHKSFSLRTITKKDGKPYSIRDNRQRYFFPDEWVLFYDSLKKRKDGKYSPQQITFKTLLHTGARIMEIQNVKVQDIDFDRGNIVLRVTKRIVNRPGIDKHGIRNIRVLALSTEFTKFLKKVVRDYELKDEDYLPIISTQGANQALKRILKKLLIPDWQMISIHNIRKTAENWMIAMGIPSEKVLKQFGHSWNVSFRYYMSANIFSFEEKREIHSIMGDIREKMMGDAYAYK